MSTGVIVYVLTGLALVVVVLTRVRMGKGQGAGHAYVGSLLLNFHTGAGLLALVTWLLFLIGGSPVSDNVIGIIALTFWWIVTVCGLLMLVRWLPSGGRHSSEGFQDSWSEGPGLSVLAHVGMLVGVVIFTFFYATHGA